MALLRNVCRNLYLKESHLFRYRNIPHQRYEFSSILCYSQPSKNDFRSSLKLVPSRISGISIRNFANDDQIQKPGLYAKFKQMYRDYWYVLVPVHLVTSACWIGGFYYLAESGVDVIALLKSVGVSDKFTDPLKDSSMGYVALAYALYKIATPVRYTVTLGGTTLSIKYLQQWGYIKPMPSREALKEMYQVKKEGFQEMYQETKEELRQKKQEMKERKDNMMGDIAMYKQEMKKVKQDELKNK